jgi:hypothetical protein
VEEGAVVLGMREGRRDLFSDLRGPSIGEIRGLSGGKALDCVG